MLRDRGDDRDVVFGIGRIQEGVEPARPRSHFSRQSKDGQPCANERGHADRQSLEEHLESVRGHVGSNVVDEADDLAEAEDAKGL